MFTLGQVGLVFHFYKARAIEVEYSSTERHIVKLNMSWGHSLSNFQLHFSYFKFDESKHNELLIFHLPAIYMYVNIFKKWFYFTLIYIFKFKRILHIMILK